jgi:hypothetical protein
VTALDELRGARDTVQRVADGVAEHMWRQCTRPAFTNASTLFTTLTGALALLEDAITTMDGTIDASAATDTAKFSADLHPADYEDGAR